MNEGMNFQVAGSLKKQSRKRNVAKKHSKNRRPRKIKSNKTKKHRRTMRTKRRVKYYN